MDNKESLSEYTPESPASEEVPVWNVAFHSITKSQNGNFEEIFSKYNLHGISQSEPSGFVLTEEYFAHHAEKVFRFQPKNEDVWVMSFPKCGTTLTQEMVWMIVNGVDVERAKQPLVLRSPFLEMPYMVPPGVAPPELNKMMIPLEMIENMPSPRVIKSHLPFQLVHPKLLDTAKVVYIARNPKDVIVSYFYHHKLMKFHNYIGDVEKFAQYFMDNELLFSPFFPHILDAWSKRNHPNILFIFYEDLKKDLRKEIKKVAAFLNKQLSEEQLNQLQEHLRFDNFAKNEAVNLEMSKKFGAMNPDGHFIRKGKTGDWKNHFSPELNSRIEEWIDRNLKGSDLKFTTELEFQD